MKTAKHHFEGKKCLLEIHNNNTKQSDFIKAKIVGIVPAIDTDYRINVLTEGGTTYNNCHPDCVIPYFYISARSAWDTVTIGPFKTRMDAKVSLNIGWDEKLIKEA